MENDPRGRDLTYEERGLQPFRSKHPLQRVIGHDRINFSSPQDLLLKKKQRKKKETKLLTGVLSPSWRRSFIIQMSAQPPKASVHVVEEQDVEEHGKPESKEKLTIETKGGKKCRASWSLAAPMLKFWWVQRVVLQEVHQQAIAKAIQKPSTLYFFSMVDDRRLSARWHRCQVPFTINDNCQDKVWCNVVLIDVKDFLLGRLWLSDENGIHQMREITHIHLLKTENLLHVVPWSQNYQRKD